LEGRYGLIPDDLEIQMSGFLMLREAGEPPSQAAGGFKEGICIE
jgi:hypothetical protein